LVDIGNNTQSDGKRDRYIVIFPPHWIKKGRKKIKKLLNRTGG
jgi:hypothetical protein